MNKLRSNHRPQAHGESYSAYCWSALSYEYQVKFSKRTTKELQVKAQLMAGYESLSRNDDVVLAAIHHIIDQRTNQGETQ